MFIIGAIISATIAAVIIALLTVQTPAVGGQDFDEDSIPTAKENGAIPVVFGTMLVNDSNVVDFGDIGYLTQKKKKAVFARKYHIAFNQCLCYGKVNKITKMIVDDKPNHVMLNFDFVGTGKNIMHILIKDNDYFGGSSFNNVNGGGLWGYIIGYNGVPNPTRWKAEYSSYKDYTTITMRGDVKGRGFYVGTQPILRPMAFVIERTTIKTDGSLQWYSEKAVIGDGQINPIHIIREVLTSVNSFGLRVPEHMIDDKTFMEAADFMYEKQWGFSTIFKSDEVATDFLKKVTSEAHVILTFDSVIDKWVIINLRKKIPERNVITFTDDDVLSIESFNKITTSEQTSQLNITYIDSVTFKKQTICRRNDALITALGTVKSKDHHYNCITTAKIASECADLDMMLASSKYMKMEISGNLNLLEAKIGDVVKVDLTFEELPTVRWRVMRIDIEFDKVKMQLTSDVYDKTPVTINNGEKPPINDTVLRPLSFKAIQLPFGYETDGDVEDEQNNDDVSYLFAGSMANTSCYVIVNESIKLDKTDYLRTIKSVSPADSTIQVNNTFNIVQGSYLFIDNEIMEFRDWVNDNEITVVRGCFDTIPKQHATNTVIFLQDTGKEGEFKYETASYQVEAGNINTNDRIQMDAFIIDSSTPKRASRPIPLVVKFGNDYFPQQVTLRQIASATVKDKPTNLVKKGYEYNYSTSPDINSFYVKISDKNGNTDIYSNEQIATATKYVNAGVVTLEFAEKASDFGMYWDSPTITINRITG